MNGPLDVCSALVLVENNKDCPLEVSCNIPSCDVLIALPKTRSG